MMSKSNLLKCCICGGVKNLDHNFFKMKGTSKRAKRMGWKPWINIESIWTQEFLSVNFANSDREICGWCVFSIKRHHRKNFKKLRTQPIGIKDESFPFTILLEAVSFPDRNEKISRPLWELSCCEMLASRLISELKKTKEREGS